MAIVRATAWPIVLPDDDGIRPAGSPTQCFYCNRPVGQEHRRDCVCVHQHVVYDVLVDGRVVGEYGNYEPYAWTLSDCEQRRNRGSWCADNALDTIVWSDSEAQQRVEAWVETRCMCGILTFRPRTNDAGPFVKLRDPTQSLPEATSCPEATA